MKTTKKQPCHTAAPFAPGPGQGRPSLMPTASGVRGGARPKMDLVHFERESSKNASEDKEFGVGVRPIGINFVNCIRISKQEKRRQLTTTCDHRSCDVALHSKRDKIGTVFGILDNSASRDKS